MTGHNSKSEVLRGLEFRRRRTSAEKLAIIAETMEPGMSVSHVARRHGKTKRSVRSALETPPSVMARNS
jgi:transposase